MAKPIVDGIEKELGSKAQVIRVDITSKTGRQIMNRYGVRAIPTILIIDGCGEVVGYTLGIPNKQKIVEAVEQLPECSPETSR